MIAHKIERIYVSLIVLNINKRNKNKNKARVSELSKNKVKWLRSLQMKKFRDIEKIFLIEGEKIIHEALREVPHLICSVYHTKEFQFNSPEAVETVLITPDQLKQISSLNTPNKALAVLRQPLVSEKLQVMDQMTLALDGIQDPGNLGTILRIADWFGVRQIVCSNDTVDRYNSKVIQASMGSIFRIEINYLNLSEWLSVQQLPLYKAALDGDDIYQKSDLKPGILIMGNEGNGISKPIQEIVENSIAIPSFGKAESLNVAVATGILLSEFMRRTNFVD